MDKDQEGFMLAAEDLHSINTGDPDKLIETFQASNPAEMLTLKDTLIELYTAQERMVNLINSLIHNEILTTSELEEMSKVSQSITKGINYVEHVKSITDKVLPMLCKHHDV